jgi:hypothetical protein
LSEGKVVEVGNRKEWRRARHYFLAADGAVWLLIVYAKAKFDSLPASFLAELKKGIEDAL